VCSSDLPKTPKPRLKEKNCNIKIKHYNKLLFSALLSLGVICEYIQARSQNTTRLATLGRKFGKTYKGTKGK
jgi:hypothetical protein